GRNAFGIAVGGEILSWFWETGAGEDLPLRGQQVRIMGRLGLLPRVGTVPAPFDRRPDLGIVPLFKLEGEWGDGAHERQHFGPGHVLEVVPELLYLGVELAHPRLRHGE